MEKITAEWIKVKSWKGENVYIEHARKHGLGFIDFDSLYVTTEKHRIKPKQDINCAIGVTDLEWFSTLRDNGEANIVNFWTPTPWGVGKLRKGQRFYFMLRSPVRKIGGYGFFNGYNQCTLEEAWAKYGQGNGVSSLESLKGKIAAFEIKNSKRPGAYNEIGTIELINPIFFEDEEFLSPEDLGVSFGTNIVRFKYERIEQAETLQEFSRKIGASFVPIKNEESEKITTRSKKRQGQSEFRAQVLSAYGNRCAISDEACLEIVEAAHIQDYINKKSNHVQNGIPLRVDIHRLFDLGLIAVTTDYHVKVSPILSGSEYNRYQGKKLHLPLGEALYPNKEALKAKLTKFRETFSDCGSELDQKAAKEFGQSLREVDDE